MIGSGEDIYKNSRMSAAKEDRLQILDMHVTRQIPSGSLLYTQCLKNNSLFLSE